MRTLFFAVVLMLTVVSTNAKAAGGAHLSSVLDPTAGAVGGGVTEDRNARLMRLISACTVPVNAGNRPIGGTAGLGSLGSSSLSGLGSTGRTGY